ncbi:MAG: 50S ribosomal protein L9 [Bacteroidales bacterium]
MDIILKQDIANLGYSNDLVTVKNGYARNYLIPKGYAVVATEANKKILAENQRQKAFKQEKIKKEAEVLADALKDCHVRIGAKAGTSGKIFGSVNALQIADAIKDQKSLEVDRKKIVVDGDSIKELGEYKATIKLHREVSAEISFEVFAE